MEFAEAVQAIIECNQAENLENFIQFDNSSSTVRVPLTTQMIDSMEDNHTELNDYGVQEANMGENDQNDFNDDEDEDDDEDEEVNEDKESSLSHDDTTDQTEGSQSGSIPSINVVKQDKNDLASNNVKLANSTNSVCVEIENRFTFFLNSVRLSSYLFVCLSVCFFFKCKMDFSC